MTRRSPTYLFIREAVRFLIATAFLLLLLGAGAVFGQVS